MLKLGCNSKEHAEKWIKHILLAVSDQVLLIDHFADIIRKQEEEAQQDSSWKVESLLRLSVDLLSLAKGPNHLDVAKAQERLVEYLRDHGDPNQEAAFWEDRAKEITEVLSKVEPYSTHPLAKIIADITKNGLEAVEALHSE
mmetsp:Transcript_25043/g.30580  ORF Transcript_25043/g.30580 Transcript_25043/m.30580 type:complete len:142 (-) Transcript_25043:512-937(-)